MVREKGFQKTASDISSILQASLQHTLKKTMLMSPKRPIA